MPIRQYLQGHSVDPETARLLGVALEMALVTLKQRREIDPLRDAVARKIIELAETGERDPERLCDAALQACHRLSLPTPILFRLSPHRRCCRTLELKPVGRATLAPAHIGYRANGPDTKAGRVPE
jgi:hypothetical protein